MKRNSLYKGLFISVALSAVLTGCGSTSATTDTNTQTQNDTKKGTIQSKSIKGKAIDGYLQYATVCLDINQDGYCQSTEPMSTTEVDGSFTLEISPQVQQTKEYSEAMLLVYGGKDKDTGTDFIGKLLAPFDGNITNITPITTLIAKAVQEEVKNSDKQLSKEEVDKKVQEKKEKFAQILDIDVDDLMKDPVAQKEQNPKLIKEALKIQKSVEAINLNADKDELEKSYEKLAQNIDKVQVGSGVDGLLDETFTNANDKKIVAAINANIDKSFEKFNGDLEKIAHITKEDIRKVKKGDINDIKRSDNDPIFQNEVDWDNEYIKSELEDIGYSNPSQDDIDKIKEKLQNNIKPGILDQMKNEIFQDDSLKEISDKIQESKIQKQKEKELEKEKYNPSENINLKNIFSSQTLYSVQNGEIMGMTFDAEATSSIDDYNQKLSFKIEGNTIIAGSNDKELLIYKSQTDDYYEFYNQDGEQVRFYKDLSSAETFVEESNSHKQNTPSSDKITGEELKKPNKGVDFDKNFSDMANTNDEMKQSTSKETIAEEKYVDSNEEQNKVSKEDNKYIKNSSDETAEENRTNSQEKNDSSTVFTDQLVEQETVNSKEDSKNSKNEITKEEHSDNSSNKNSSSENTTTQTSNSDNQNKFEENQILL